MGTRANVTRIRCALTSTAVTQRRPPLAKCMDLRTSARSWGVERHEHYSLATQNVVVAWLSTTGNDNNVSTKRGPSLDDLERASPVP
jgi:hypothetical protein